MRGTQFVRVNISWREDLSRRLDSFNKASTSLALRTPFGVEDGGIQGRIWHRTGSLFTGRRGFCERASSRGQWSPPAASCIHFSARTDGPPATCFPGYSLSVSVLHHCAVTLLCCAVDRHRISEMKKMITLDRQVESGGLDFVTSAKCFRLSTWRELRRMP